MEEEPSNVRTLAQLASKRRTDSDSAVWKKNCSNAMVCLTQTILDEVHRAKLANYGPCADRPTCSNHHYHQAALLSAPLRADEPLPLSSVYVFLPVKLTGINKRRDGFGLPHVDGSH